MFNNRHKTLVESVEIIPFYRIRNVQSIFVEKQKQLSWRDREKS